MGLSQATHEADNTYADLFVEFVRRSANHSLVVIRNHPISPPADVREQARHVLGFALDADSTRSVAYELLLELAPKMEDSGHRDDWLPYLDRGIGHSRDQKEHIITAKLLVYSGMIHQLQGRLSEAQNSFQESINLATAINEPTVQARSLIRLAFVQRLLYKSKQATALAQQALSLLPSDHLEQAAAYSVLGIVAYDQKDWPHSIAHFRKALAIARKQNDPRSLACRLRDLGMFLRQAGDLEDAARHYTQAIDLFDRLGGLTQGAITRINLSAVYLDQARPAAALKLCNEAEAPLYDARDQVQLAHLAYNRGLAYAALEQHAAAAHYLQLAIDRYGLLGRSADQAEVLADLRRLG